MILPKHKPENDDLSLYKRVELLQDWVKQEIEIKIRAANYCLETELYDLTLPGHVSSHNEWIPRAEYLATSSRYASHQKKFQSEGLSNAEYQKFELYIQDYAQLSVEELKQEIEELSKITK